MSDQLASIKCLVWDLDNTLWNGTLLEGDDVAVSEETRDVVVELDRRGVLQSIASKNDHDLAWQRLEQIGLAEYFVLPHIGWGPKSTSIRSIADNLNFAADTIAFIDDQPAERAEVQYGAPATTCYAAEDLPLLLQRRELTPRFSTVDSRRRRLMYQAGERRADFRAAFAGPDDDFLRSLDVSMSLARATENELTRVEELTLRTSQMNATGVHYDDETLRSLLADPEHAVIIAAMEDRFGPHGAVGVLLLRKHRSMWNLKLLATSCRVVSYGAGSVILQWLANEASAAGVHLVADFKTTDRNRMMDVAYRFAGFVGPDDHDAEPCPCLSEAEAPADAAIQRLHLVPSFAPTADTVTLSATALAG